MHILDRYLGAGPRIHLTMISLAVVVYYLRVAFPWTGISFWEGAQLSWATAVLFLWVIILSWSILYLGRKIGIAVVTKGPYRYVRHPIYTSEIFFGWLIVFFILNTWLALVCMVITFYLAHHYVNYEEDLMHKEFGEQWIEYAKRTPKLIPSFSSK